MASNRGMGREEAIFWVALTIFGTGLYLVSDAHLWGGALLVIGLIGLLYSLRHEMTPGGYRTWIVVVSVGVATIVSGYDLYQRNQEPPQPITVGGSADVSAYPPSWSLLPGSSDASFVDARGTNNLQVDRNYVVGTGTFAHLIGGSNISITGNYAEFGKTNVLTTAYYRDAALKPITNADLRERAMLFVKNLRDFEFDYRQNDPNERILPFNPTDTPAQRHAAFDQQTRDGLEFHLKTTHAFNQKFRGDALALLSELVFRTKSDTSLRTYGPALGEGILVGGEPVEEAASQLERLARSLPLGAAKQ